MLSSYVRAIASSLREMRSLPSLSSTDLEKISLSARTLLRIADAMEEKAGDDGFSRALDDVLTRIENPAANTGCDTAADDNPLGAAALDSESLHKALTRERDAFDRADGIAQGEGLQPEAIMGRRPDPEAMERLARFLEENLGMGRGINLREVQVLAGGRSKTTLRAAIDWSNGISANLIIRMDNSTQSYGTGIAHEFPLLQVVRAAGVKVPRPLCADATGEILGVPFLVVEEVSGKPSESFFSPPRSRTAALEAAENLAAIHRCNVESIASVLPAPLAGDRQSKLMAELLELEDRWRRFTRAPSITMCASIDWLKRHVGNVGNISTLIHGDFGFHNIHVQDGHVTAILDWEFARVGHPAEDLGYCRSTIEKMTSWHDFMTSYRAAGGVEASNEDIAFFGLRSIFMIIVAMLEIRDLFERGKVSGVQTLEVICNLLPAFHGYLSHMISAVLTDLGNGPKHARALTGMRGR